MCQNGAQDFVRRPEASKFCEDMLEKIKDNLDILREIITGDEIWVFQYHSETKRQSMQLKIAESLRLKKMHDTK